MSLFGRGFNPLQLHKNNRRGLNPPPGSTFWPQSKVPSSSTKKLYLKASHRLAFFIPFPYISFALPSLFVRYLSVICPLFVRLLFDYISDIKRITNVEWTYIYYGIIEPECWVRYAWCLLFCYIGNFRLRISLFSKWKDVPLYAIT